jgi:hypothetical protein
MAQVIPKGVFCLEGDWWHDLKRPSSIEPLLTILDQHYTTGPAKRHIRCDVATPGELEYYLGKWTLRRFHTHPILYLGFHGRPNQILLSDLRRRESSITIEWLEKRLENRCEKRLIHFGACRTLEIHGNRLRSFLRRTGALAVSGYWGDVDWLRSAAFELVLLTEMQYGTLRVPGINSMVDRIFEKTGGLARELGFQMIVRKP